MVDALPRPSPAALTAQWSVQPLALAVAVLAAGWYLTAAHRRPAWPAGRSVAFLAGVLLLVWTSCGFPQAYAGSLYWVWTGQTLALLLVVPALLVAGRPLELVQHPVVGRALRSRPGRALLNPLVGPAIGIALSAVLFFGPVAGWAIGAPAFGWVLQLVLVGVGVLIALPLAGGGEQDASLAVGLALLISIVELVLDALPGLVLRLQTHTVTGFFDHRAAHEWAPHPLHDQQIAGAILWCVAEVVDLPFLVLVFRRWVRADTAEAARVDAVLEAERATRGARPEAEPSADEGDAPWWLTDPSVRDRFRR